MLIQLECEWLGLLRRRRKWKPYYLCTEIDVSGIAQHYLKACYNFLPSFQPGLAGQLQSQLLGAVRTQRPPLSFQERSGRSEVGMGPVLLLEHPGVLGMAALWAADPVRRCGGCVHETWSAGLEH